MILGSFISALAWRHGNACSGEAGNVLVGWPITSCSEVLTTGADDPLTPA